MGKESGGWHWRWGGGSWVGSHMAADKERGKADRARGTEEGGRREEGLTLEGQYAPFCQVEKQR